MADTMEDILLEQAPNDDLVALPRRGRHPDELEAVGLARTLQGVAPTREEK